MLTCPNCGARVAHHPTTGCILGVLIQVIRDRGEIPERKLRKLHATADADALWNDIGRVVDRLEEGGYST